MPTWRPFRGLHRSACCGSPERDTGQTMPEESTTRDLVELVRHLLHAASCMDGDVFVRFFAPDAVFLTGVGRFEGRDAICRYVDDFNSSYDERSYAPDEAHDLGNGVAWFSAAVTGRLRGTSADVHLRFAVVVTHAGGVVSQWTDYATIDQARAAAKRLAEARG
jgi:SnoaL-like domain